MRPPRAIDPIYLDTDEAASALSMGATRPEIVAYRPRQGPSRARSRHTRVTPAPEHKCVDKPRREPVRKRRQAANAAHRATKRPLKGREKHKAAETEVAARRREVGRLHLERIPQWEIAERMRVDEGTISRDLKAIREEWRAEARSDVGEATERELKSLAASERRLRSEIEKIKPGANIALLCKLSAEIVRIQTHRARLLGLEAPTKLIHQGPDGKPIQHDVTARGPDAATLDEERALRALTPEARRAVLARARAEIESAGSACTQIPRADDVRATDLGRSSAVETPQDGNTGERAEEGPAPAPLAPRVGLDPDGRAAGAEEASMGSSACAIDQEGA